MKSVFTLQSKTKMFYLFSELNAVFFGDQHMCKDQFIVNYNHFFDFYESMKLLLVSMHKHELKTSIILQNENNGETYHWEVLKIFNALSKNEEFAVKLFIINTSNDVNHLIILSENQLLCFLHAFCKNIISSLTIDSFSKLWLKHCSTQNFFNIPNNYLVVYNTAEMFSKPFNQTDKVFELVELFEYFYFPILAYKNLSLLMEK